MSAIVYRLIGPSESLLYVGCTSDFASRLRKHRRNLGTLIVRCEIETYASRAEALEAERVAIQRESPLMNLQHALGDVSATGFGQEIWGRLERKGYSIVDVAAATDIPLTTLHRRLRSQSLAFTLGELTRIAALLNTTAGVIVTEFEEAA